MGVLVVFYYEKNVSLQDTSQKLVIKIRSRYMSKKLTFYLGNVSNLLILIGSRRTDKWQSLWRRA